jgi:4-aminobutyrate aminotransferase
MGRTGKWWAFEHYDVKPDIISIAKALQVGATAYDRTFDPNEEGVLSSTWGAGSRIDMAIGTKIIDVINHERLLANAVIKGEALKKGLNEMIDSNGIIDVRGIGLMIGIEFDRSERRDLKLRELFNRGLLLLPAGQKAMRVMPPLTIENEDIQEGLAIMNEVLLS